MKKTIFTMIISWISIGFIFGCGDSNKNTYFRNIVEETYYTPPKHPNKPDQNSSREELPTNDIPELQSLLCPSQFVLVPGNSDYHTKDFCVAKYEMKQGENEIALSKAEDNPWVNIRLFHAKAVCSAIGEGYRLITNDQWQTLARNIESVDSNWNQATLGSAEGLNRGHSDNLPDTLLAASDNDDDACAGTEQSCSLSIWDSQRRTHRLSNDLVIWDLSGNASEWVQDMNIHSYGKDAYFSVITESTHPHTYALTINKTHGVVRSLKNQFGPFGDYSHLQEPPYGGLGYFLGFRSTNIGVARGGTYSAQNKAGIFRTVQVPTHEESSLIGFRCVYEPGEEELEKALEQVAAMYSHRELQPEAQFQDCQDCPKLTVIDSGSYMMGSDTPFEGPQHSVTINSAFAVGIYEVTNREFAKFIQDTNYSFDSNQCLTLEEEKWKERSKRNWQNTGYPEATEAHPVVCVSWEDANAYVNWLSEKTREKYRLLTEAEWEYVTRAGTVKRYNTSSTTIATDQANYHEGNVWEGILEPPNIFKKQTLPVGTFDANMFGLHDTHGNVWEWLQDCWADNYENTPNNGTAQESDNCEAHVLRGGSWMNSSEYITSTIRSSNIPTTRTSFNGFRVARDIK